MKRVILAIGAMAFVSVAYAQETQPNSTDPETPAVTTPNAENPTAPVAGKNSFTEAQAKKRLEDNGYTNVGDLELGDDGIWRASAQKNGVPASVTLDYQGNITEAK